MLPVCLAWPWTLVGPAAPGVGQVGPPRGYSPGTLSKYGGFGPGMLLTPPSGSRVAVHHAPISLRGWDRVLRKPSLLLLATKAVSYLAGGLSGTPRAIDPNKLKMSPFQEKALLTGAAAARLLAGGTPVGAAGSPSPAEEEEGGWCWAHWESRTPHPPTAWKG